MAPEIDAAFPTDGRATPARAPEGTADLAPFPAVRAWLGRIEAPPGFPPMPRTRAGLETMEDAR